MTQTTAPIDTEISPAVVPKAKAVIVVAVVLTAVLEVLDSTIVNVAVPHMQAAFGITSDQTTWILTSYIVASVVVMPLTGFFSQRFGRRNLISVAIIGFAAFSFLCGLAQNVEMMVAFRLGQGLFGAFLIPLSQSILFDSFPREKRGQAMAMFGLGVVVAPVLGPTLGAFLTDYFSWRAVFYVNMPLAAFALFMIQGELKSDETRKVDIDWVGLILMVAAIGGLQLMLDQGESQDWFSSPMIQIAALVAGLAGLAFVVRAFDIKHNIIDLALFKDRSFAAANIAIMGFGLAMFGSIALIPLFVQGLLGYPIIDAGYLFMPRGLAAGFSMVFTGAVLMGRFDPRVLTAIGLVLTGLGNIAMSWLNLNAGFWDIAWPGVISGLGMGLFFVPMSTLAFQNIGRDRQDEASGIYGVARSIGSSIGIAVVGWQLVRRIQYHWNTLSADVTLFNPTVQAHIHRLGLDIQSTEASAHLTSIVATQAQMLAFQDVFLLSGWVAFLMLPTVLMMQKPDHMSGGATSH